MMADVSVDSRSSDGHEPPPAWEPEPLQLPIDAPPVARRVPDESPEEHESRVLVIDLA